MERENRRDRGAAICLIGIVCNLLLAAGKIAVGILTGFVSVMADGFNNLSDCGSGIVALASVFIAAKPADKEHPFGHRRAEYIAAMITGLLVLVLAAETLRGSVLTLWEGEDAAGGLLLYLVLGISVAVKAGMVILYALSAKKLGSDALKAAATDSFCDGIATLAVIAGALLLPVLPSADGWAGIVVSLFIAWQGVKLLIEASSKLLGRAPDPALAEQIRGIALGTEQVLGVHDLRIYSYGEGVLFATLHVEMDAALPMLSAHTVIDGLELRVKRETGVTLTVHLDPVDLFSPEESSLKIKVWERARELAEGLEMHDFRLIPGTDRVEFDVGIPYACKIKDGELESSLCSIIRELGNYEPVIHIERE